MTWADTDGGRSACGRVRSGIGEEDTDLAVLRPARSTGVLPLDPGRADALLQEARVVHDQHRAGVTEVLDDVVTHVVQDVIGVPVASGSAAGGSGPEPACPASSASVQPFFRSNGAIRPRIYASADSRGSDRLNRCTNRSCTAVQPTAHDLTQQDPHP